MGRCHRVAGRTAALPGESILGDGLAGGVVEDRCLGV
jgi:hypothetical protein